MPSKSELLVARACREAAEDPHAQWRAKRDDFHKRQRTVEASVKALRSIATTDAQKKAVDALLAAFKEVEPEKPPGRKPMGKKLDPKKVVKLIGEASKTGGWEYTEYSYDDFPGDGDMLDDIITSAGYDAEDVTYYTASRVEEDRSELMYVEFATFSGGIAVSICASDRVSDGPTRVYKITELSQLAKYLSEWIVEKDEEYDPNAEEDND